MALFGVFPQNTFAYHETLNLDYPRIPVPGGSFDLNKFLEREHVLADEGRESQLTLGVVMVFVFVFLIWISGFILFGALLYTGVMYIVSGNNPGKRSRAQEHLTSIMWGMGILLFSYIIVFIISTDIVRLKVTGTVVVNSGVSEPRSVNESGFVTDVVRGSCHPESNEIEACTASGTLLSSTGVHQSVATEICRDGAVESLTDSCGDHNEIGAYILFELDTEDAEVCGDGDVAAVKSLLEEGFCT